MSDYNPYQWKYYQKNREKRKEWQRIHNKELYWSTRVMCPWCGRGVELPDKIHSHCAEAKAKIGSE